MLKIGIITMYYNSNNYGGLLQSYALEKFLINLGYEAKQICYCNDENNIFSSFIQILKSEGIKQSVVKINSKVHQIMNVRINKFASVLFKVNKKIEIRKNAVTLFRDDAIVHTNKIYNSESIKQLDCFDVYICGSDQIWHSITTYKDLDIGYWLKFVKHDSVKISYAASIALDNIPPGTEDKIQEALIDFDAISLREESARKSIQTIMGSKAKVEYVLDPTFLLSQKEWDDVAAINPYKDEKYIFVYLLGDNRKDRECIKRIANNLGLKIITIPYLQNIYRNCDKNFGDIQLFDVSPNLWISLIKDAKYIFTDSFHCSVFSILFNKEFYTFKRSKDNDRESMNSRIYDLFSLLGIERQLIPNNVEIKDLLDAQRIDYKKVESIIEMMKEKSMGFLLDTLEKTGEKHE